MVWDLAVQTFKSPASCLSCNKMKRRTWGRYTPHKSIEIIILNHPWMCTEGFPGGAGGKEPSCQCRRHETQALSLGREDPLEEGMVILSSILAWRIPWTEEPGRLLSKGSQRVGHDLAIKLLLLLLLELDGQNG